MEHKLTPLDLALWAALPMAHTSRVEGRITMILDKSRKRTLPRRALIFGVAAGAAMLVPLAMLKPTAKAQTAPAVVGAVQIIGVADATTPSAEKWDRDGNPLSATAFWPLFRGMKEHISAPLDQKALSVAFRVPGPLQQSARIIVNSSDAPLGRIMETSLGRESLRQDITMTNFQMYLSGGPVIYTAGFPAALPSANFQVGVASDAGAETVDCPKTMGKVRLHQSAGDVIFTLFPHPQGGAVFMVSDHFRRTSPLKADNFLQVALHDGENYERSVYALDKSGKVLAKLLVTLNTWPDATGTMTQEYHSIKTQQTGHLSSSLLRQTASFRLIAQPYQWTEFKNVALQPVQDERATATASAPVPEMTPWSGEMNYEDWKVARTYRLIFHTAPSVSGTRPEPPVGGRLVSGPGRVANVIIKPWKPGKSNILTVQYDYTPKITDKVHPDVIELLTKDGTVATVITQQPHQSQMVKP